MSDFEPELGQLVFNQSSIDANNACDYTDEIRVLITRINYIRGTDYLYEFKNEIFAIRPYSWAECNCQIHDNCEETCEPCKPNFHHIKSDFKIRWYKHPGRSASCNKQLRLSDWHEIFHDCYKSLVKYIKIRRKISDEKSIYIVRST